MARQHDVLRKAEARHGAVADPLLRHEGGAEAAAVVDAAAAHRLRRRSTIIASLRDEPLAGDGVEELLLAVAGDARDPDHLAGIDA